MQRISDAVTCARAALLECCGSCTARVEQCIVLSISIYVLIYFRITRVAPQKTCGFVLQGKLDPKKLQLQLTGFLEKSTGMFMEELWGLLVDAQSSLGGIPSAFLQDKKDEMAQAKVFI